VSRSTFVPPLETGRHPCALERSLVINCITRLPALASHRRAGMKHPLVRGKGLLLSGQCLLYKFLAAAPESEHPWPEHLAEKIKVQKRRRQRKRGQRIKGGQSQADISDDLPAGEGGPVEGAVMAHGEEDVGTGETQMPDGEVSKEELIVVEEEEEIPLDAEEQAAFDQQVVVSRSLHSQCESTLQEALAVAMTQKVMRQGEASAGKDGKGICLLFICSYIQILQSACLSHFDLRDPSRSCVARTGTASRWPRWSSPAATAASAPPWPRATSPLPGVPKACPPSRSCCSRCVGSP